MTCRTGLSHSSYLEGRSDNVFLSAFLSPRRWAPLDAVFPQTGHCFVDCPVRRIVEIFRSETAEPVKVATERSILITKLASSFAVACRQRQDMKNSGGWSLLMSLCPSLYRAVLTFPTRGK